jgi:hypothetical protein
MCGVRWKYQRDIFLFITGILMILSGIVQLGEQLLLLMPVLCFKGQYTFLCDIGIFYKFRIDSFGNTGDSEIQKAGEGAAD